MGNVIRRTPAETLAAALGEAETAPVVECIVIMTDENGDIITCGSTSVLSTRLGLLEMAKAIIIADMVKDRTI